MSIPKSPTNAIQRKLFGSIEGVYISARAEDDNTSTLIIRCLGAKCYKEVSQRLYALYSLCSRYLISAVEVWVQNNGSYNRVLMVPTEELNKIVDILQSRTRIETLPSINAMFADFYSTPVEERKHETISIVRMHDDRAIWTTGNEGIVRIKSADWFTQDLGKYWVPQELQTLKALLEEHKKLDDVEWRGLTLDGKRESVWQWGDIELVKVDGTYFRIVKIAGHSFTR